MSGDLRYAARQLIQRPAWTLMVVATLALGVGASTSILTLIDTMLFKPAPWNDGRFVRLISVTGGSTEPRRMSYADYLAYRDRTTTLAGVLAYSGNGVAIGAAHAEYANAGLVSGNYFEVLGIHAQVGRTFAPDEDTLPGAHPVVVLSDALWRQLFGADPEIVNHIVAINGQPFTIIGVAPRGFTGIAYADNAERLWMPLAMQRVAMPTAPGLLTPGNAQWLHVVGRLRDGATAAQARAELRLLARQLNSGGIPSDQQRDVRVLPLRGGMNAWEQNELASIFALVASVPALVVLVACANVANVLMARNVSRRKELAMRQALGASRGRLVRLLLTEALMLAVLAAAAGFAVSFALTALIAHLGELDADFSALVMPDRRALLAATAVAIVTTLFFGLAPALTATRFEVLPTLKEETTTSTAATGRTRLRRAFIVTQVALSLALLIVAGLFLQSLFKLTQVDPGFEPRGVLTASFDTELLGYTASRRNTFITEFMRRASSMPGAASAAITNIVPLGGEFDEKNITTEQTAKFVRATSASVSPGYFDTLRLPLVRGREFSDVDVSDAAPVAIVNETLAQRLWPGSNAVGKRLRVDGGTEPWREVIGVARDAKYVLLSESPRPAYYVPLRADAVSRRSILVRIAGDSRAALSSLTTIAHDLDPNLPLITLQTLEERIHQSVNLHRAAASLVNVLGGLTLLLAAVGLYGVAAHSVSLRTRELGVRMSLGARAADIFGMVVRENLSLSLIGVGIGLGISVVGLMILTSFLFGLTSPDPLAFIGGSSILCLVTLLATYIPARRAANLDPLAALRHE